MNNLFSKTIKKWVAKLATFIMMVGVLAPALTSAQSATLGTLKVDVRPESGVYTISGPNGDVVVNGSKEFTGDQSFTVPYGDYTVNYKSIPSLPNLKEPGAQTQTLDANTPNGILEFVGQYTNATPQGTLKVDVRPESGVYTISGPNGDVVVNGSKEFTGDQSFTVPYGDYTVNYKSIPSLPNLKEPGAQTQTLDANTPNGILEFVGQYTNATPQGTLKVDVRPESGVYTISGPNGDVVVNGSKEFTGDQSFTVPYGDYTVNYKSIPSLPNLKEPGAQTQTLDANTPNGILEFVGQYTNGGSNPVTGTVEVEVNFPAGVSIPADYDLLKDNTAVASNETATKTFTNQTVGTYTVNARSVTDGAKTYNPNVTPQSNSLDSANLNLKFVVNYTESTASGQGTVNVNAVTFRGGQKIPFISAEFDVKNGSNIVKSVKNQSQDTLNNATAGVYTVDAKNVTVNGITYNASVSPNQGEIKTNETLNFEILYVDTTTTGELKVNVEFDNGNPFTFDANYTVTNIDLNQVAKEKANNTLLDNQKKAATFKVGAGRYEVTATDVVTTNGKTYTASVKQVSANNEVVNNTDKLEFTVVYKEKTSGSNFATIQVNVKDDKNTPNVVGKWNLHKCDAAGQNCAAQTPAVEGTATQTLQNVTPGKYQLVATNVAPYASVNVNPSTFVDATAGATVTFDVTYTSNNNLKDLTVTKTANLSTVSHSQIVEYTVNVKNNSANSIPLRIRDSFAGKTSLQGSHGGSLDYLLNKGNCGPTLCEDGNGAGRKEVNQGDIFVTLDSGKEVTITYQAQANNQGAPYNGFSTVNNEIEVINTQTNAVEKASFAVRIAGPTRTTGGSGGGGGGGTRLTRENMELEIVRTLSTDGKNFSKADTIKVPENTKSTLYVKQYITNPNRISVVDAKFKPLFDAGNSKITASEIKNLNGAAFSSDKKEMVVRLIEGGKTVVISYEQEIEEKGGTGEATIGVELTDFKGKVVTFLDANTYNGLGTKYTNKLKGGKDTPTTGSNNPLAISVKADRSGAKAGEVVNYVVKAKNNTDKNLTNVLLSHHMAEGLSPVSTNGATVDGQTLTWKRASIKPGQTATYTFSVRLNEGKEGGRLKNITEAMTNEFEKINPVVTHLNALGGKKDLAQTGTPSEGQVTPKGPQLAQTGPMTSMLIVLMSILGYFGYGQYQRRRYLSLKRKALDF